jgi:hypothetical protein
MADRLAGADAFTAAEPARPAPVRPGRRRVGEGWEATNKRMTFYVPLDVLDALAAEVARGERSNSQVIVDALRAHLGVDATA